jgi:hypothetical protein
MCLMLKFLIVLEPNCIFKTCIVKKTVIKNNSLVTDMYSAELQIKP